MSPRIEQFNPNEDIEPRFDAEKISLLLDIKSELVETEKVKSVAEQRGLHQKQEFHFTVIGTKGGTLVNESLSQLDSAARQEKIRAIENLATEINWSISFVPEYFFIKKEYDRDPYEERQSIIQSITIEGLDEFYQRLNALLGTELATPMPHITLFANSTIEEKRLRGIGINSQQELEQLNPEKIEV